jgi:hypothetical protein
VSAISLVALIALVWRPFAEPLALRSTPSVVTAVRDLSRLETVEYHVERVIDLRDQQSLLFGLIRTEDAILFVAVGQVTAGVDLAELRDEDVVVDREAGTAEITLPPARVLTTRVDNERSWVYARVTGALARRDEELETNARREAERTLERAAIDLGILARAQANAERTVSAFVRSLGYTSVTVRTRSS